MLMVLQAIRNRSQRNARNRTVAAWRAALRQLDHDGLEGEGDNEGPRVRRERLVHPRPEYESSAWAVMLRDSALTNPASKSAKTFRRRFRIPHPFFKELVKLVKDKAWFPTATADVGRRKCIPIELKVR